MLETPPCPAPLADGEPADLVTIGTYATYAEGFAHGLVILAMGRAFWLSSDGAAHHLRVEPDCAGDAQQQLARFDRESIGWPPRPLEAPAHPARLGGPLVWALAVLAVFWGETLHPGWASAGSLDADAIVTRHEWWRVFTALFLHADVGHLLTNAVCGVFVFGTVLAQFGRLRGWIALAASAVLANAATAVLNRGAYSSIGASTAVFAGVGLLTGAALNRLRTLPRHHRWRAMVAPLAAGCGALALYGAGGVHVDVLGHAMGFIAGGVWGWFAAVQRRVA